MGGRDRILADAAHAHSIQLRNSLRQLNNYGPFTFMQSEN